MDVGGTTEAFLVLSCVGQRQSVGTIVDTVMHVSSMPHGAHYGTHHSCQLM